MQSLLVEYNVITYDTSLITEAADVTKPLTLRNVVLQRADHKNQNGRVYPKDILAREAITYKNNFVTQRRALGELDHPESPVVNLKNVCCNVTDLWFEKADVRGNIEILSTPSGNIVRELIKNNIRLGVSSRGMGSVKQIGENSVEVQEDFSLICFDIVSNPSTQGAFINENKETLVVTPYSRVDTLIYDFLGELK
jgi:Prohead core protein serine protease